MDQKVNPILPPPSVDDLLALGAEARLGQVDFANRLVPTTDDGMASVTSVLPRRRPVAAVPELPAEPEAVDEPEVETVVEPEPVDEPVVEPEVEPEPAPIAIPAAALAPKAKPAPRSRPKPAAKAKPASKKKPARSPKPAEPAVEPPAAAEPLDESVLPAILPIANLSGDAVSASAAYDDFYSHAVPAAPVAATAPTLRIPMEPVPTPAPVVEATADFGGTVQEVADAAIERLRDAENATLQHLAALEAEAARRAELLTAQAELDAELIRITARREAHAIISAARSQAGLGAPSSRDARQLAEISDAVSRFAESIESTLTPMHAHPGHGDQA